MQTTIRLTEAEREALHEFIGHLPQPDLIDEFAAGIYAENRRIHHAIDRCESALPSLAVKFESISVQRDDAGETSVDPEDIETLKDRVLLAVDRFVTRVATGSTRAR